MVGRFDAHLDHVEEVIGLRPGARAVAALNALMPGSTRAAAANVVVCPDLDPANILFNVLKVTGGHGVTVGPIVLGVNASAHILTPSATVRRGASST